MALCGPDQIAFLVVGVWRRIDDRDAVPRWDRSGKQHVRRIPSVRRRDRFYSAVPARTKCFRNAAHDRAFHLCVSFWPDAPRPRPRGEHANILKSAGRGGGEGSYMKGVTGLFLGIFGTFAFSWAGLTLIPNWQIGHLDPQSDEEQTDIYPMPKSGMAERGRKIYAANGCVYCHSQQVRADYAASDIDRKWGTRRSAPRDYIFERPAMLGKLRMGPDLSNIGKRAPSEDQNASPSPAPPDASSAANAPAPHAANSPAAVASATPPASASPAASASA